MPRRGRINIAGGIYHIMQRGIERCEIFRDDSDRKEFLARLGDGLKETGHRCFGWVIMPNHFHLLIRTGGKPLSDLMRKLLTGYAIYFNQKYKRVGYLYQNRYKSILCQEEAYLLELVRYVHLNPLRWGVVKDIEGLNKYKWSGHSVIMGNNKSEWQATEDVLEHFGKKKSEALRKYIEFINDGKNMGKRDDLTGGGLRRSAGGWEGVLELKKSKERWQGDERILGDGSFVEVVLKESESELKKAEKLKREGWDLEKLINKVCEEFSIDKESLKRKGRGNNISDAKMMLAYTANKKLGIGSSKLLKVLNCNKSGIGYLVRKGRERFGEKTVI